MTITTGLTGHVTNTADQLDLRGNMLPVSQELTAERCDVIGEIPSSLNGMFVRNGPNPMYEPIGKYHMFDGDGMLHGVTIANGVASYRNRWIRSKGLEAEMRLGHAAYPGLSDVMNFPDESVVGDAGPVKNPANTHIVRHANKILALWEQGLPTHIAADLGTVGPWNFDGELSGAMTAHPRIDPRTGMMFFFSYNLFAPHLSYYVADAAGKLVHKVNMDLPAPVMIHDMLITDSHSVFMDSPVVFNLEGMMSGEPMVQWQPENGTRIGVIPHFGGADDIRWFDVETSHVQHFWNAWADGNRIELSGCRFNQINFGIEAEASETDAGVESAGGLPHRYWIDLQTGDTGSEDIDDMHGEFCRVNDDYAGVRTNYLYMSGFTRDAIQAADFDTIVKYDQDDDSRSSWYIGDDGHLGESAFAPDPNGTKEDDGWLINSTYNSADDTSEVIILDARDVAAGPVARVQIPQRMPFGFHANWFPTAS